MQEITFLKENNIFAFNDHFFITGQTGSGKSVAAEWRLIQYTRSKKFLVIDCGDMGRFENFCYSLPEKNAALINRLYTLSEGKEPPNTTDSMNLLICGSGLYTTPKLPKNVTLCSFKKEDMKIKYMTRILGDTKNLMITLQNLQAKFGEDFNLADLEELTFKGKVRGKKAGFYWGHQSTRNMMINHLRAWLKSGIFSDHPDVKKIDFKEIFNTTGKIISLNSYLLMTHENEIAYSIWLDQIFELKRTRQINYPIVMYIRELSNFMAWGVCKDIIRILATQGRGYGIYLVACFQSPTQIQPTVIRQQAGYTLQLKAGLAAASHLLEIQIVPKDVIWKVPMFRSGEGILVTGQGWFKNVQIPPTPHMHADPRRFDVLNEMGETYGWKDYDAASILNYGMELLEFSLRGEEDVEENTPKEVFDERIFPGANKFQRKRMGLDQ